MRVDRDQADGFFGRQRSEPFLDATRCKAEAARADQIDADEVAIFRAAGIGLGDVEFAPGLLLVDRHQPSATAGQRVKNAEHARLGMIDDLDDAADVGVGFVVGIGLDAQ